MTAILVKCRTGAGVLSRYAAVMNALALTAIEGLVLLGIAA